MDDILEGQNSGFDFAVLWDGMKTVGFGPTGFILIRLPLMNDTCFGPFGI